MKHALLLFSSLATYLVFGGSDAAEAASDPRATQLTYAPWTRMCFGKSNCFVGAGAKGACYPSGGAVLVVTDDKKMSLSVHLGTKSMLESTISVQVDQGAPIPIPHPECDGLACRGKLEIDSEFIERLKHSQTITLEATTVAHKEISLSLSLADFAKAYDGPESDPPKVREEILGSEKFKELVQRQEEERKAFLCQE